MKKVAKILSVALLLAACVGVWVLHKPKGVSLSQERMALTDSVINSAIERDDFPGAVLCVVGRAADGESMGDILYLKA